MPNDLEREALAESDKKPAGRLPGPLEHHTERALGFLQGSDSGDEDRPASYDDTKGTWISDAPFTGVYEPGAVAVKPDVDGTLQPAGGPQIVYDGLKVPKTVWVDPQPPLEQPPDPPLIHDNVSGRAPPLRSAEEDILARLDAYIENLRSEIVARGLKLNRALSARREFVDEIPF